MPVILNVPQDPTDLVIAGEQLRQSVMDFPVALGAPMFEPPISRFFSLVGDEDGYPPMNTFLEGNRVSIRRAKSGEMQVRDQAGIATPCGAWISNDWSPLVNPFEQATDRWLISGVTKDDAGSPLGNCRVVALETGRIQKDGSAIVGETISDGSGNYTIEVPMNTAYEVIAYKPGSPDVAGITRNDIVPVGYA